MTQYNRQAVDLHSADNAHYMRQALMMAQLALPGGDVPIGAVVVKNGEVIGRGYNRREADGDPTAHAEMIALRDAARHLGGWYLHSCTLYVTLEPCPMCTGAALQARIPALCFGAADKKAGCCASVYDLPGDGRFPHKMQVLGGVMERECASILQEFFAQKRTQKQGGTFSL